MTGPPPIKVGIVADDQFTPAVKGIVAGATSQLSPIQRFAKALTLSEAREGSQVVRRMKAAIDELAFSAAGASGPWGRLAVTVGQFGIGGAIGLTAIGGFAAIAGGIKQTLDYVKDLDASFRTMDATIASLVTTAGPLLQMGDLGAGEGPESDKFNAPEPGLFARGMSRIQGGARGLFNMALGWLPGGVDGEADAGFEGDVEQAFDVRQQAGDTRRTMAYRIRRKQNTDERNRRIQEAAKRRAEEAEKRRKALDAQAIVDAELSFGFTGGQITFARRRTGLERPTGRDLALGFGERPREMGAFERDLGFDLATTLRGHPAAPFVDESYAKTPKGVDIRALLGAGVGLAGAARSGGFGDILTAEGGVVAALPGGQLAGAGLAAAGGLISLFTGGKAKVTVENYSESALKQMREVRSDPQAIQFIVIPAGDPRAVAYDQGRLASRGVIARGS